MRKSWIESLLERSLANQARLELGLEQRFDALTLDYETPEHPRQSLPKGIKVSEKFFDRLGVGRTLLILGAPGSGKTTTLLELARDLIDRVETEGYFLLPVVLHLSSWATKQESLDQWILQELEETYHFRRKVTKNWLKERQLILLLDALDEVKVEARDACIAAINKFKQIYGETDIVVCSRLTDYENLTNRLQFQAAIFIQPLTPTQIEEYLNQAGNSLAGVKQALQTDEVLREMAQAPLMLSVIALAYEKFSPEALPQMPLEERQKHLWNKYIQRMLERRKSKQYSDEQTVHWLKSLAQQMIQESKTVFLIERMQPSWLSILIGEKTRTITINISIKSLFHKQFIIWQRTSLFVRDISLNKERKTTFPLILLKIFLIIGLINNEVWRGIKPAERLNLSKNKAIKAFLISLGIFSFFVLGLYLLLLLVGLGVYYFSQGDPSNFISYFAKGIVETIDRHDAVARNNPGTPFEIFSFIIPFFYFLFLLVLNVLLKFDSLELERTVIPNQGIWNSAKILSTIVITVGVISVTSSLLFLEWNLGLFVPILLLGLPSAFYSGMMFGGETLFRHSVLRLMLYCYGFVPWNYARFLDECCDRLLLQRVGGGYIFMHRLLMEHFAQMEVEKR